MSIIPFAELQILAEKYNLSHVIMLAHETDGPDHIVTYGQTILQADQAAEFGNALKDALGWPESLHKQSAKATKRIQELEAEVARLIGHKNFARMSHENNLRLFGDDE